VRKGTRSKSLTTHSVITREENALRAVALRSEGFTLLEIGDKIGMTKSGVHKAIKRAVAEWRSEYIEIWEEQRKYASDLNEGIISANYAGALRAEPGAGRAVHNAMVRQAKLHGLNADRIIEPVRDNPYDGISNDEWARQIVKLFGAETEKILAIVNEGQE
jgi:hypothetical protein